MNNALEFLNLVSYKTIALVIWFGLFSSVIFRYYVVRLYFLTPVLKDFLSTHYEEKIINFP